MMFLGTEKEWSTLISFAVVVVAGLGFVFGALVTWGVSGPTEDDLCRAQGGSFNKGICYIERTRR